MTGRVGWTTAMTRSNGNHSSRWMYNNGARARASRVPLSSCGSASGIVVGTAGM